MSGFVYIWRDRKYNRYYIGSHWGSEYDSYVCSSTWMRNSHRRRPEDFKRRIIARVHTSREELLEEEQRWLSMIKDHELATRNSTTKKRSENVRYYNVSKLSGCRWHTYEESRKAVGEIISSNRKGRGLGPRDPSVGLSISAAKKRAYERRKETGDPLTPAQRAHVTTVNVGRSHTEEWKAESSKKLKEQWTNGTRSREKSEETRKKISESKKGKWTAAQQAAVERNAAAVADKISKDWRVTSPSGEEFLVRNLKKFCSERGLANGNITKSSGSKGWRAEKAPVS